MSVRNIAFVTLIAFAPMLTMAPPAVSGDKIDLRTPGATIDVLKGNKRIQAGDAKIKVKPGKRSDCVRISAGNAKIGTGKIKNGKCKS